MSNILTDDQLLATLRKHAAEAGSQNQLARSLGISKSYLSAILTRQRRPSRKLLLALGLRRRPAQYERRAS